MAQTEQTQLAPKSITPKSTKRPSRKPKSGIAPPELPVTKRDRLRAQLEQADGASLTQLAQEFGWQPHTVRAAISGLRKAGLEVQREPGDTSSVYRIVGALAS